MGVRNHARRWLGIDQLEVRMGATENALVELDSATNEVAAEIDELRGEVAKFDEATAERLGVVSARLRGLAADPETPVPAPPVEPDVEVDPAPEEPQV